MIVADAGALRPDAAEVELVASELGEVGTASAAELAADLGLPLTTIAGALRRLERDGRARVTPEGWLAAALQSPYSG